MLELRVEAAVHRDGGPAVAPHFTLRAPHGQCRLCKMNNHKPNRQSATLLSWKKTKRQDKVSSTAAYRLWMSGLQPWILARNHLFRKRVFGCSLWGLEHSWRFLVFPYRCLYPVHDHRQWKQFRLLTSVPYDGFWMEDRPNSMPHKGIHAVAVLVDMLTESQNNHQQDNYRHWWLSCLYSTYTVTLVTQSEKSNVIIIW
jgi:hypothetical protein